MADKQSAETKLQILRQQALKKAAAYQRLFTSPDGKVVLADLEAEFRDRELHVSGDSHATHVRVGEFNVIKYIHTVMEVETDGELA